MLDSDKKKVQDGMFMYTKEVIPRSMLDLDSVLGTQAISCHKCLLGFCGDRKTTYPAAAGHRVLMTSVQSLELRDEIFVQLCKHLTLNPDARSTLRGWILMCMCVDLFPPSIKFTLYLLNFLDSASNDKAYGEYARYCLARLQEALDLVRAWEEWHTCSSALVLMHHAFPCTPSTLQDELTLEKLVLERGMPPVEYIWCVHWKVSGFSLR